MENHSQEEMGAKHKKSNKWLSKVKLKSLTSRGRGTEHNFTVLNYIY